MFSSFSGERINVTDMGDIQIEKIDDNEADLKADNVEPNKNAKVKAQQLNRSIDVNGAENPMQTPLLEFELINKTNFKGGQRKSMI